MLVSVIVLINLLIAMMSDTYQSIQSQSDIEWKYGLSKLIRKMQKTRTAPSPLNLLTTWLSYLIKMCRKKASKRKKKNLVPSFVGNRTFSRRPFSPNNRIMPSERYKDGVGFSLLRSSPLGSQLSLAPIPKIENVVEWDIVRRKYRMRFGDEIEKPSGEDQIVNGMI